MILQSWRFSKDFQKIKSEPLVLRHFWHLRWDEVIRYFMFCFVWFSEGKDSQYNCFQATIVNISQWVDFRRASLTRYVPDWRSLSLSGRFHEWYSTWWGGIEVSRRVDWRRLGLKNQITIFFGHFYFLFIFVPAWSISSRFLCLHLQYTQ